MVERTKRGDEEQKETDEAITGQPVTETRDQMGTEAQPTNTTRDKGRPPVADRERRSNEEEKKST